MTTRPKVTRLVLFKHGVAYLERRGPADGRFELSFRGGDMNDVLKSLAVGVTRGDATVGAVAYEAPADPEEELSTRNLRLAPGEALTGLLNAARGRTIAVVTVDGTTHRGEAIGVDEVDAGSDGSRRALALRTGSGAVGLVDLAEVRSLEFVEQTSREDLEYLIDRSRAATAGLNRTVLVDVTGTADELWVSYIVPAPVWRVSYRLVCEGDSITLVAMGIVHNPVDEDLDDVELTLTTGQPVSFSIDLYHGKLVQRAVVRETDRAGYAPTSYESAYADGHSPDTLTGGFGGIGGAVPAYAMPVPMAASPGSARSMATSYGDDLADAGDSGEHFEYRVSTPISLKRGMASMVPLLVAELADARKERIWRDGSTAAPDIVLAFDNTTGAVLEEGPAVVYDDATYAGEAMVPYTTRGADVRLAFAKDLAVKCSRSSTAAVVSTRLTLGDDAVLEESRSDITHTLRAENGGDEPVDVVFELRRDDDTSLRTGDGFIAAFEETASHRRFRIEVPAHGAVEASVGESRPMLKSLGYSVLSPDLLRRWFDEHLLDDAAFDELSRVLELWEEARRFDQQGERLQLDRDEVFAAQARITEQLAVLRDGGPEGAARQRNVSQLVALQDEATALDAEIRRSREAAEAARMAATAELQQVIAGRAESSSG